MLESRREWKLKDINGSITNFNDEFRRNKYYLIDLIEINWRYEKQIKKNFFSVYDIIQMSTIGYSNISTQPITLYFQPIYLWTIYFFS